jgi:hypothetical protein
MISVMLIMTGSVLSSNSDVVDYQEWAYNKLTNEKDTMTESEIWGLEYFFLHRLPEERPEYMKGKKIDALPPADEMIRVQIK